VSRIEYAHGCSDDAIACCKCKSNYVHHDIIEIWERPEDKNVGLHLIIHGSDVEDRDGPVQPSMTVDLSMSDNKATRRQWIVIGLWGESCGHRSEIRISQYKGETHITHEEAS